MAEFSDVQLEQLNKLLDSKQKTLMFELSKHVDRKFEVLSKEMTTLKSENKGLKSRLCTLETQLARNKIEISGFPTEPKLTEKDILIRLARSAALDLTDDMIYSAKRVGPVKVFNEVNSQLIVAEFFRPDVCERFLTSVQALRKSRKELNARMISSKAKPVPVYVSRMITREVKRLRWLAMQKKTALKYEYCWITQSGKLCMKKSTEGDVITITCEEDLLRLK